MKTLKDLWKEPEVWTVLVSFTLILAVSLVLAIEITRKVEDQGGLRGIIITVGKEIRLMKEEINEP